MNLSMDLDPTGIKEFRQMIQTSESRERNDNSHLQSYLVRTLSGCTIALGILDQGKIIREISKTEF